MTIHPEGTPQSAKLAKNGFALCRDNKGILRIPCVICTGCLRKNSEKSVRSPLPSLLIQQHTPPPRSHKWKQSFVWGEWSRFTVDGLPTKDHATITTGPGSAAPTFTQYDLTHASHSFWCRHHFSSHLASLYLNANTVRGLPSIFLNAFTTEMS